MLSRLLLVSAVGTLVLGVSARLEASPADIHSDEFETQGLEQLEQRYGVAFPGYAGVNQNVPMLGANVNWQQLQTAQMPLNWQQQQLGSIGSSNQLNQIDELDDDQIDMPQQFGSIGVAQQRVTQQQMPFNLGYSTIDMVNLQQPVSLAQIPQYQSQQQQRVQLAQSPLMSTESTVMLNYQQPIVAAVPQRSFGGIGMLGAAAAGGTSKATTVAQPIYAQNMVVPKIITQPIYRPHAVTQPIVQQQLINQPIVETRQVIQPVIRRIITQPIIRPEIYESTTIQPTLKTETVVQPHIVQQTVVTPQLQTEYSEQAPIQEAAKTNVAPTQVQPTVSGKKQSGGLGFNY